MKLYAGVIPSMQNTPCKIAVFVEGNNIKVFEKAFFRNGINQNWYRNVNFEKYKTERLIEERLFSLGFIAI